MTEPVVLHAVRYAGGDPGRIVQVQAAPPAPPSTEATSGGQPAAAGPAELRQAAPVAAPLVPEPPPAGEVRVIPVPPGTAVVLADPAFSPDVANYTVDGDDLVITLASGAVLRLDGFFAHADLPPTLSVLGGPARSAAELLAGAEGVPQIEPAAGPVAAPPAHGGGAGFSPFEAGDIGEGIVATGPLGPTDLAFSALFPTPEPGASGGAGEGEPPVITVDSLRLATFAEQSFGFRPHSSPEQIVLVEGRSVNPNGVDQHNLTLDAARELTVIFEEEGASFRNSLGFFSINPDGTVGDVRILFPDVNGSRFDPDFPSERDGTGPLTEGESAVSLGVLPAGTRFGFFILPDGADRNPHLEELLASGRFELRDGRTNEILDLDDPDAEPQLVHIAEDDTVTVLRGLPFLSFDPTPDDPDDNPLNPDGHIKTVSFWNPGAGDYEIGFEDLLRRHSDQDFNDVVFRVHYGPVSERFLFWESHADNSFSVDIADPDSAQLSRAEVFFVSGRQPGDQLIVDGSALTGTGISVTTNLDGSLTFSGISSVANYEAVLNAVVFQTTGDTSTDRVIGFRVTDDDGNVSSTATSVIDIVSDVIPGSDGDDVLSAPAGIVALAGRDGDDRLTGSDSANFLDGGDGDDVLTGNGGDDWLDGGPGSDQLEGGDGSDTFLVTALGDGLDEILDFDGTEGDRIDLDALLEGSGWGGPGSPTAGDFAQVTLVDWDGDSASDDVLVSVDLDGAGSLHSFHPVLALQDPTVLFSGPPAISDLA